MGFTPEEIMAQMKLGKRDLYSNRILVKSDISWAELSLAETHRYEIPGLVIQAEPNATMCIRVWRLMCSDIWVKSAKTN